MSVLVIGIIALVLGLLLIYWINRRKFYRRNTSGLEVFSSFEKSLSFRFLERIGKWIGYVLVILGILSIFTYRNEKQKALEESLQSESTIRK
ncbi:hypothetical protein ABDK00_009655 [Niabella insulamsoli]|uniref:molybdenum ABC transporter permease n=1 Tax=Niabella insulamsoli TaxID=3144874 RepID=UPI0031FD3F39